MRFDTDLVAGDSEARVRNLRAGDVLRAFNGIQDTVTLTSVEDLGLRQYGERTYHLHFEDGSQSMYVNGSDIRYLATGGARDAL